MSQASNVKQSGEAENGHNRTAAMLHSFRSKLAQRLASRASSPPKTYASNHGPVPGLPGHDDPPSPTTVFTNYAVTADGHQSIPVDHLRCTACHGLGQLVGEARLAGITLAQRQNDAVHSLRMLVRDASAAIEAILDSQNRLDHGHEGLYQMHAHLMESCPACIILGSGIREPVGAQDLTDETVLRQRLAEMAIGVNVISDGTASDAISPEKLASIDEWVAKVKQAAGNAASQRSHAQSELSKLGDMVKQRQAPFQPSRNSNGISPTQGDGKVSRSQSVDMGMLGRASNSPKKDQVTSSTALVVRSDREQVSKEGGGACGGGDRGGGRGGEAEKKSKPSQLPKPDLSNFKVPPPNWIGTK